MGKEKVTVFGASGFVGSHVADSLTDAGYEISVFDIHESEYLRDGQRMITGDITDSKQVMDAVEGADYVYDFAGIADLDSASTLPAETAMINVVGTCNILNACVEHNVKCFVFASSFYANSSKGGFYRCSKQAAEIYIEEYRRRFNLPYVILRYGSLYGPRAGKNNGIRKMITGALNDNVIQCSGTEEEVREYIHVKDAADLSVRILSEEYWNKSIVITGHDSYKKSDVVRIISEILNKDIFVEYRDSGDELHYVVTPYAYRPMKNYKLISEMYHDFGQGLIECMEEIDHIDHSENMYSL